MNMEEIKMQMEDNIELDKQIAQLQEYKKTVRRIEGVLKMWASATNPDHKKICVQIQQALSLGGK